MFVSVRLVIARCQVDYMGRLTAHLPMATRLILIKSDGSVSIHADDRAYKPLNWMSPPCSLVELGPPSADQVSALNGEPLSALWEVRGRDGDTLQICLAQVFHDSSHELGVDPGLQKDGVEAHLQALLAEHPEALAPGLSLVRREHPTPIGPVDLLCRDAGGAYVAVEIKRRGEIDGVEQLSRSSTATRSWRRSAASWQLRPSSRRPGRWPKTEVWCARSWTTTPFVGSTRRFRRCSSCTYPQVVNNVREQRPPDSRSNLANKQVNGYTSIRYSRLTNDALVVRAAATSPTWCTRSLFSLISATEPVRRSPVSRWRNGTAIAFLEPLLGRQG
jgi:endonuclease